MSDSVSRPVPTPMSIPLGSLTTLHRTNGPVTIAALASLLRGWNFPTSDLATQGSQWRKKGSRVCRRRKGSGQIDHQSLRLACDPQVGNNSGEFDVRALPSVFLCGMIHPSGT